MEQFKQTFEWPDVDGSRFASLFTRDEAVGAPVVLVGLPDDLGVRLNNGRPGASEGPRVFRETIAKMGARCDLETGESIDVPIYDAGDVTPAPGVDATALAETHQRITEAVRPFHEAGKIVIGIGGGHDLTFPMVRALSETVGSAVGGVNVDLHLDVRECAGSGMPFRALIEGGHLDASRFVEYGTGRFDNSLAHVEWLRDRGGTIQGITGVRSAAFMPLHALQHATEDGDAFVSIDLDSVDGAMGVSAVPTAGVPIDLVLAHARRAGESSRVRHFDLMELAPTYDVGNRTARIAALLFQTFIAGIAGRVGS